MITREINKQTGAENRRSIAAPGGLPLRRSILGQTDM